MKVNEEDNMEEMNNWRNSGMSSQLQLRDSAEAGQVVLQKAADETVGLSQSLASAGAADARDGVKIDRLGEGELSQVQT